MKGGGGWPPIWKKIGLTEPWRGEGGGKGGSANVWTFWIFLILRAPLSQLPLVNHYDSEYEDFDEETGAEEEKTLVIDFSEYFYLEINVFWNVKYKNENDDNFLCYFLRFHWEDNQVKESIALVHFIRLRIFIIWICWRYNFKNQNEKVGLCRGGNGNG